MAGILSGFGVSGCDEEEMSFYRTPYGAEAAETRTFLEDHFLLAPSLPCVGVGRPDRERDGT